MTAIKVIVLREEYCLITGRSQSLLVNWTELDHSGTDHELNSSKSFIYARKKSTDCCIGLRIGSGQGLGGDWSAEPAEHQR